MCAAGRRRSLIFAAVIATLFRAVAFFNSQLTHYIESDRFRDALETETAKGLHFPTGSYSSIKRTGFLTAKSDRFDANDGRKAMHALDTRGISAKFDPLGLFRRRWQLDELHIQSGETQLQIYKHHPEPLPAQPWFAIFLPTRVYLKRVEVDSADMTWLFRVERAGFFGTRLLITPHGSDFNYEATGGTLKMVPIPDVYLRHARLLITKTLLTLYDIDLAPSSQSDGAIHAHGNAGIGRRQECRFGNKF